MRQSCPIGTGVECRSSRDPARVKGDRHRLCRAWSGRLRAFWWSQLTVSHGSHPVAGGKSAKSGVQPEHVRGARSALLSRETVAALTANPYIPCK